MSGKLDQIGRPSVSRPFNGLREIQRRYEARGDAARAATINDEVFIAYGTADEEFTDALLVDQRFVPRGSGKNDLDLILQRTYREFTAGEKVSVGEDVLINLESGQTSLTKTYVALASEAEGLVAAVGTILGGRACQTSQVQKQGVGALITETYISAGILAQSTSYENNGALEIYSVTYYNGIAPTPTGFYLTGVSEQNPNGLPGRTYRFAKGQGQISYAPSDDNNGALSRIAITYLTAPSVAANPITTPAGYVLVSPASYREAAGHRVWSADYAKGAGQISWDISQSNNGKLNEVAVRWLSAPGAPSPISMPEGYETYVLVDGPNHVEAAGHRVWSARYALGSGEIARDPGSRNNGALLTLTLRHLAAPSAGNPIATPDGYVLIAGPSSVEAAGHVVWSATFVKGEGQIRSRSRPGPVPGTTLLTVVALGTAVAGDGPLFESDDEEEDGFVRYTRTTIEGTITGTKQSYADVVDVAVPGTVELVTQAVSVGGLAGNTPIPKVTPPRLASVKAMVTVEVMATPPTAATPAYDIGAISCSVVSTRVAYNSRGFDSMSTVSGDVTVSAERRSAAIAAHVQVYPGCYLSGDTTATGSFSYVAGQQFERSSGGTIVSGTNLTSYESSTLTGTGATAATGWASSGVLRRRSRIILTTLDGTNYWEVITWVV